MISNANRAKMGARILSRNLLLPLLLDRYVFFPLLVTFLFGVGVFAAIGMTIGVVFDLVRQFGENQLPLPILVQIFWLQLPYAITFALPMAVLLASLITFNRLSADNELIALRSVGVSVYRLLMPVLALGLLVGVVTFSFNLALVPLSRHQANQLLEQALQGEHTTGPTQNIFYPEYGPNREVERLFYARQYDGKRMYGLTILDFSREGVDQVITAESAVWNPTTSTWTFANGTIYLVDADGNSRNVLQFSKQQLRIPRDPLALVTPKQSIAEMSLRQAQQYLQQVQRNGDGAEVRKLEVHIQQQYAIPWQGLVFGLIGTGLGIRPQHRGRRRGLGLCILIILGQYLLTFVAIALGRTGILIPGLAAWSVNLLGLAIAIGLLIRANR